MLNKITTAIFALILTVTSAMAQAPAQINYQGVARDTAGNAIANQNIKLRFKVRNNAGNGTIQYQETRTLTTSATGLFTVQIGGPGGSGIVGSMSAITWNSGTKYLQVEMDPTGGSSFTNMGAQLLVSVPYALQATKANSAQQADSAAALNSNAVVKLSNLETTNASVNQVLQFDGSSWQPTNLYDGLMLPYIVGDPNLVSFGITNTSAIGGTAIYGKTNTNSTTTSGVRGESTAASGNGVYGKATGATSFGVLGENTTGIGVKGKTTGAASIAVLGENTSWIGVQGTTSSSATNAAGVYGLNNGTTGSGVTGVANFASGYGVQGSSTTGTGVLGYSNSNVGVYGNTINGTALKGYSNTGYGLDVYGNVKIAGGSTNPGAGKILTSDANGNATWQNSGLSPKIGFLARGMNPAGGNLDNVMTTLSWHKILFYYETADYGNCFSDYNQSNKSMFIAPVAGFYNLSSTVNWVLNPAYNYQQADIKLVLRRNGSNSDLAVKESWVDEMDASVAINIQYPLLAGDQVWVEVRQSNLLSSTQNVSVIPAETFFSGNLIFQ